MMNEQHTDDDLVVHEQAAIRIYTNPADAVVISQADPDAMGEHQFVYVHRHYLPAIIKKLQTYLPEGGA